MKNIIRLLFVLLITISLSEKISAQGNLQFNQVIHYTLVGATPQNFTVPANKVWKIEAANVPELYLSIYLRNTSNQNLAVFSYSTSYTYTLPYWLPSGFSGNFFYNYAGYRASVSIIEFNVVP